MTKSQDPIRTVHYRVRLSFLKDIQVLRIGNKYSYRIPEFVTAEKPDGITALLEGDFDSADEAIAAALETVKKLPLKYLIDEEVPVSQSVREFGSLESDRGGFVIMDTSKAWLKFGYEILILTSTIYAIAFLCGQVNSRTYLSLFTVCAGATIVAVKSEIYSEEKYHGQ